MPINLSRITLLKQQFKSVENSIKNDVLFFLAKKLCRPVSIGY